MLFNLSYIIPSSQPSETNDIHISAETHFVLRSYMRPYFQSWKPQGFFAVMESRSRSSHSQYSSTDAKMFVWMAGRWGFDSPPMSLPKTMAMTMLQRFAERVVCPVRRVSKEMMFPTWMNKTITKLIAGPVPKNVALWLWGRIKPSDQLNAVRHTAAKLLSGSLV